MVVHLCILMITYIQHSTPSNIDERLGSAAQPFQLIGNHYYCRPEEQSESSSIQAVLGSIILYCGEVVVYGILESGPLMKLAS